MRNATLNLMFAAMPVSAATRYVTVTGAGVADCSDWSDACTLSTALSTAGSGDDVWVVAETYSGTIDLVNGVKIVGGFAGSETAASQSDPITNQTVIDGGGTGVSVTSTDDAGSTMLRGFRITNGHNSAGLTSDTGGGAATLVNSSAMFVQCVFDGSSSASFGEAVYVRGSGGPEFVNCTFNNNGAVDFGSGTVTPIAGGAVYVHSGSPRFTNCLFTNNTGMEAGAMAIGDGTPTLVNCTITGNNSTVGYGGGLYDPESKAQVKNCILWANTAVRGNDELENYPGRFTVVSKSDVAGGFVGTGNIDSDPLFVGASDFHLQGTSPCKNAGQTMALPLDIADLDWDGNTTEQTPLDLALKQVNLDGFFVVAARDS